MTDFAISQNVPDFVLLTRILLFLSDFYKFGIKIIGRYVCSTLIYIVSEISWLSQVARNFLTSLYNTAVFWAARVTKNALIIIDLLHIPS